MEAIILEDNNHDEKYSNQKQVDEIAEKYYLLYVPKIME